MDTESFMPFPVSYSPLKHHLSHQLDFITSPMPESAESLKDELLIIGDNVIDVYEGDLSVSGIGMQVLSFLAASGIAEKEQLITWLGTKGYKEVVIKDGSRWVIRLSENKDRFIHIHPGKKSVNTFRLRGTTLKTVMAFCILAGEKEVLPDIGYLNQIRKGVLGLSPVKSLPECGRITAWLDFYREKAMVRRQKN